MIYAADGKDFFGFAFYLGEGEEKVFGGDVVSFQRRSASFSAWLKTSLRVRLDAGLGAGGFGEAIELSTTSFGDDRIRARLLRSGVKTPSVSDRRGSRCKG